MRPLLRVAGPLLAACSLVSCLEPSVPSDTATATATATTSVGGSSSAGASATTETSPSDNLCPEGLVYRCFVDDGGCSPESGCVGVNWLTCNPASCDPDSEYGWTNDCSELCESPWECAASGDPALLQCEREAQPCDVWTQDCPDGYKCAPLDDSGGSMWNANLCVPVVEDPAGPGEPCVAFESPTSGHDSCEEGAMCWDVDPDTLEGTCHVHCENRDDPTCPSGSVCSFFADSVVNICLLECDPFAQDCEDDERCRPTWTSFACWPDSFGDGAAVNEPCQNIDGCAPGLACVNPDFVPDCPGWGCCTPFCELSGGEACPSAGQLCLPWYAEGMAPEGYGDLGFCGIPQ